MKKLRFEKIELSKTTIEKLQCFGTRSQNLESVIIILIKHVLSCGRFWQGRV